MTFKKIVLRIVLTIFFISTSKIYAQSDVWYIGSNISIDFSSGTAVAGNGITLGGDLTESSTAITDANGDLLFAVVGSSIIDGGENAVNNFESFKPLTAEAIVTANPDVILMFTTGAQSLNGVFDNVPGILQTNAGKNKRIITMDGQYLAGFGPRVGKAALELNEKLSEILEK